MNIDDFDAAVNAIENDNEVSNEEFVSKITDPRKAALYELDALMHEISDPVQLNTLRRVRNLVKEINNVNNEGQASA